MKTKFLIICIIISNYTLAQSELDKVVNGSCDCITASTSAIVDYDSYLELIMECVSPLIVQNSKELARELGISDDDELTSIELIGSQVGEKLVIECPRFTELTFQLLGDDPQMMDEVIEKIQENEEDNLLIEEGTILSISKEIPCVVILKNAQNETMNYYWIESININERFISDPGSLKGKKANIVYYLGEIYNPKIGEYQTRKILSELTVE